MTILLNEILDFKAEDTKALVSRITNNAFHYQEFHTAAHSVKNEVHLPKLLLSIFIYLITCSSAANGSKQSRNV
jgi:hypothetical protein